MPKQRRRRRLHEPWKSHETASAYTDACQTAGKFLFQTTTLTRAPIICLPEINMYFWQK